MMISLEFNKCLIILLLFKIGLIIMDRNWNQRLKERRLHAKLTLNEVSGLNNHNLSQQSLIKYGKGEVFPRIDVLEDLCNIYKCSFNYVLYGSENTNIILNQNDYLITIWYLLVTKNLKFDGKNLLITNDLLRKNIKCLNIYNQNVKISSLEDVYNLINGIKNMHTTD